MWIAEEKDIVNGTGIGIISYWQWTAIVWTERWKGFASLRGRYVVIVVSREKTLFVSCTSFFSCRPWIAIDETNTTDLSSAEFLYCVNPDYRITGFIVKENSWNLHVASTNHCSYESVYDSWPRQVRRIFRNNHT